MADVQKDNGYTPIAHEILEKMATIKLSPTQYRMIFIIWRYTYGFHRKEHNLSLSFLAESTGCDKRQIQRDLKRLEDRKIIKQSIKNGSYRIISFNKNYDEWDSTIGETTNGNSTNGETTNGRITNPAIGETTNPTIGNSTNGTIGETTNQERYKDNFKYKSKDKRKDEEEEGDPIINLLVSNKIVNPGELSSTISEDLNDITGTFGFEKPEKMIIEAIKDATRGNGKTWKFIYNKLNLWRKQGIKTLDDLEEHKERESNVRRFPERSGGYAQQGYSGSNGSGKSYEQANRELELANRAFGRQ